MELKMDQLGLTWHHVGTKLRSWPLLVASWVHFVCLTAFVVALGRPRVDLFAFRRAPASIFDPPGTLLEAIHRHFSMCLHVSGLACSTWQKPHKTPRVCRKSALGAFAQHLKII